MKKLNELYKGYPNILIRDIKSNSKEVKKGDLFVCIQGVTANRNDYVNDAIRNGAVAVVSDKDLDILVPLIKVKDTNNELIRLCKKFYNFNNDLFLIGVTGTNGKTTIATYIQDLLGNDICGYMGTNGIICSKFNKSIRNTTPGPDKLYKYFDKFVKSGCKYLSMEASSEAFYRDRLKSLKFDIGIYSNISEDHLNVHKSLKNYKACKKKLFRQVKDNGYSIINIDDKYANEFIKIAKGKVLTYGKNNSDLQIINIKEYIDKTLVSLKYKDIIYNFNTTIVGEFNIYNLCAAILSLLCLDLDILDIIKRIKNIKTPLGRVEFLDFGQNYKIILDYAHTTDAFIKLYSFLNKVKTNRIITVTGSAGGREHEKRASMGKVVLDNSDLVIFTMDDPRYEDVNSIIDELVSSSKKTNYERIINREEAIYKALDISSKDDIVLIAGKAHDNYMAIKDKYISYNDYDVINNYFKDN